MNFQFYFKNDKVAKSRSDKLRSFESHKWPRKHENYKTNVFCACVIAFKDVKKNAKTIVHINGKLLRGNDFNSVDDYGLGLMYHNGLDLWPNWPKVSKGSSTW